jgi:hypothetical protein
VTWLQLASGGGDIVGFAEVMLTEEDRFEGARREITELLFDAYKRNREVGFSLEKVLISLSAGSLLFSMTFISALAPAKHWLIVLFLAWICFAGSIVLVIIGMRITQLTEVKIAVKMSELLEELEKRKSPEVQVRPNIKASPNRLGILLGNYAVGVFLAGIVCLGTFVGVNLWWAP